MICLISEKPYQLDKKIIQEIDFNIENNKVEINKSLERMIKENSIGALYPDFVEKYYDYEKNENELNLKPDEISIGSKQKFYCKCFDCKIPHSYLTTSNHRIKENKTCKFYGYVKISTRKKKKIIQFEKINNEWIKKREFVSAKDAGEILGIHVY